MVNLSVDCRDDDGEEGGRAGHDLEGGVAEVLLTLAFNLLWGPPSIYTPDQLSYLQHSF